MNMSSSKFLWVKVDILTLQCIDDSDKDSEFLKNNNYTKEEVMSGFKQLLMQSGYTDLLCLVKAEE